MVNTKIICKTDAEVLLDFVQLKDSGFAFSYEKTEDGISQKYVNCNGKVFGPYDSVNLSSHSIKSAEWAAYKGEFELSFKDNGKEERRRKPWNHHTEGNRSIAYCNYRKGSVCSG